jgi:hypothetical protein
MEGVERKIQIVKVAAGHRFQVCLVAVAAPCFVQYRMLTCPLDAALCLQ